MNEESEKKDIDEDKSRKALFVQRLCAFIFDMLLVSLIASFISTPFLNSDKIHELEKKEQETSSYDEGTIIAQSRTKGSTIISGTTLRVTVAIKPKAKPVEKENEDENKPETDGDELSNPENKTNE